MRRTNLGIFTLIFISPFLNVILPEAPFLYLTPKALSLPFPALSSPGEFLPHWLKDSGMI